MHRVCIEQIVQGFATNGAMNKTSHLRAYPDNEALRKVAEIAVNFKGRSSEFHSMIVWTMRELPGLNTVWYQRLLKCQDFPPQG
jgi:hypothetical protein